MRGIRRFDPAETLGNDRNPSKYQVAPDVAHYCRRVVHMLQNFPANHEIKGVTRNLLQGMQDSDCFEHALVLESRNCNGRRKALKLKVSHTVTSNSKS